MDDDEMEKLRLDLELRLRRMERTRSADELESIKSEENSYSSLGSLSPIELAEIGMNSPLDEKLVQEKLIEIKKRLDERTEETIENFQRGCGEIIKQQVEDLRMKRILTEPEETSLRKFKSILRQENIIRRMAIDKLHRVLLEEENLKNHYNHNNRKDYENQENQNDHNYDQELFSERYIKKKEKYDKIKDKIGDEIDQETGVNKSERTIT